MSKYRDKQNLRRTEDDSPAMVEDPKFRKMYPAIAEFMMGEEGTPLADGTSSTILLFVEEGLFKLCLNDRSVEASAWASGTSVEKTFQEMEESLEEGTAVWRSKTKKGRNR